MATLHRHPTLQQRGAFRAASRKRSHRISDIGREHRDIKDRVYEGFAENRVEIVQCSIGIYGLGLGLGTAEETCLVERESQRKEA